jgi:hypothetical protein
MENWGLVTYRETALLVDPENTSSSTKQWVALVVGTFDIYRISHWKLSIKSIVSEKLKFSLYLVFLLISKRNKI